MKSFQAREKPHVEWKSSGKSDEFYTLIFTNPDGHLKEDDAEVLHWFVYVEKKTNKQDSFIQKRMFLFRGNIPGNQIDQAAGAHRARANSRVWPRLPKLVGSDAGLRRAAEKRSHRDRGPLRPCWLRQTNQ